MLVYGCVSSHVSKPSSLPRISHGAEARGAKVLSRTQPLRSTNSETTFIVQTFAKYGLYQLFMLFKRAKSIIVCIPTSNSNLIDKVFTMLAAARFELASGMVTVTTRAASFSSRTQPQPPAISADKMHF